MPKKPKKPAKKAAKKNPTRKPTRAVKTRPAKPEPRQTAKQRKGVPKTAAFLAAFRITASITRAAKAAGIARCLHYRWLRDDQAYAAEFEQAKVEAADVLEDEAVRRAHDGVKKPIMYKGKRVGWVHEYSDRLMEALLKAWKPEKYRERESIEHTGPGGAPIDMKVVFVKPEK